MLENLREHLADHARTKMDVDLIHIAAFGGTVRKEGRFYTIANLVEFYAEAVFCDDIFEPVNMARQTPVALARGLGQDFSEYQTDSAQTQLMENFRG